MCQEELADAARRSASYLSNDFNELVDGLVPTLSPKLQLANDLV